MSETPNTGLFNVIKEGGIEAKQPIRHFTRSTEKGKQERKSTADKIRKLRESYKEIPQRTVGLAERIEELSKIVKTAPQTSAFKLETELLGIEDELNSRSAKFSSEVFNFFFPWKKKGLEKDRQAIKDRLNERERAERLSYEKGVLDDRLSGLLNVRERLRNESLRIRNKFYSEQGEILLGKLTTRREEEDYRIWQEKRLRQDKLDRENKNCLVENIMRNYDVFIVHGTLPWVNNTTPGNPFVSKETDWKGKMAFIIEHLSDVTLSTSTVGKDDSWVNHNMWSPIGLILSGGLVTYAQNKDAISIIDNKSGKRKAMVHDWDKNTKPVSEQIDQAIKEKKSAWNELGVEAPQIAGIYVAHDGKKVGNYLINGYERITDQEIFNAACSFGLRVYSLGNGVAYELGFDENTQQLVPLAKVSSLGMTKRKYKIPEKLQPIISQQASQNESIESLV